MRWFAALLLLCALFAAALPAYESYADDTPPASTLTGVALTALNYCNTQMWVTIPPSATNPPTALVWPLIECFADPTSGIIPTATNAILTGMSTYFIPIVKAMATLMVLIFAINIITGHLPEIKGETFKLLFKFAGVFYFLTNATTIYPQILAMIQQLATSIAQVPIALIQSATSGGIQGGLQITTASGTNQFFCLSTNTPFTTTPAAQQLWGTWDCVLGYLFGYTDAANATVGIGAFLMMMMFTKGTGTLILSVAAYVLMMLIFSAVRFIHIYLMAILGFSFLYCFGYVFVPLLMFKNTFSYFQKWLSILIGQLLTPVLVLGFMGIMLIMIDVVVFSGPNSVMQMIGGSCANATATGDNCFTELVQKYQLDCYKTLFTTGHGNSPTGSGTGTAPVTGPPPANPCSDTTPPTTTPPADPSCTPGAQAAGTLGTVRSTCQPAETPLQPFSLAWAFHGLGLNLSGLATNTTNNAANSAHDPAGYVANILIAFISSALMLYVLYTLIDYIPKLAADLAATGTSAGGTANAQLLGQNLLRGGTPVPGGDTMQQQLQGWLFNRPGGPQQ